MKIKKILVSQPKPATEKSPYFDLAKKINVQIDFRPFIHIEGIDVKEFRQQKVNLADHSAIIFTSRTAIDHFFRVAQDMRFTVPDTMKYFCISESTAFYLQKYITYRKRKIFYGNKRFDELMEIIVKHTDESFLVPLSDAHKAEIPNSLDEANITYSKAILYNTVSSDLSDLKDVDYDIVVFFSPSGIKSLVQNFPKWKQNGTKIASFGPTTANAVTTAGYRLDIQAPMPKAPSMAMALEQYIHDFNKK